jgi:hypothetical protein
MMEVVPENVVVVSAKSRKTKASSPSSMSACHDDQCSSLKTT